MNLNLEFYEASQINIEKGSSYSASDPYGRWYDVSLNIKNKYFNYNETRECLLDYELWDIYHTINKCLNNKLEEDENFSFIEEAIELYIPKSTSGDFHCMEFKILINLGGFVSDDYYSITLYDEEMIKLRDYIEGVLKNSKKTNSKKIDEHNSIKCPKCGDKLLEIIYGMPTAEIGEKAMNGEVFIGGCIIEDEVPKYHCNNCRINYFENLEDFIEKPNNFED